MTKVKTTEVVEGKVALTAEQEKELKKKFATYWAAKERERAAKAVADDAKELLFKEVEQLPEELWNGGTFRLNTNVVRLTESKKLVYPTVKSFDKSEFMDKNREYAVESLKVNEALVVERLLAGNDYLASKGFTVKDNPTIKIERS
mgnify:CR=1 FL=1